MSEANERGRWGLADIVVGVLLLGLTAAIIAWAARGRAYAPHPGHLSLSYWRLPEYALYSWLRMAAAYVLSLVFAIVYAYAAAYNKRAEKVLLPILDILQSIPVLSFLPVVLLAFIALFPGSRVGVNVASIVLIFTGQVWNMVFSLYNGLITIPRDLREAARSLNLSAWQRFRILELPYATGGLVWNSMMSWSGGWFFLMASEMFSLGSRHYQMLGIGSYLQAAANRADWAAEGAGLIALIAVIVLMDQLVWRPLLAWADKFKMELVEGEARPRSQVLMILRRAVVVEWVGERLLRPLIEWSDRAFARLTASRRHSVLIGGFGLMRALITAGAAIGLGISLAAAVRLLGMLHGGQVMLVLAATGTTLLRVLTALLISVLWTVPVGVFIGLNPRWAASLTPLTQIAASVPATALFPGMVALLIQVHGGMAVAAILLMVLGTQWYLLFNIIAGASAIPEDLREATRMFRLRGVRVWTTLILPAIYPSLITGLITAAGGAWNASIVAEYISFHNHVYTTFGIGAVIAESSQRGAFPLLLLSTFFLAATVVLINRLLWRPLYNKAANRYSLS